MHGEVRQREPRLELPLYLKAVRALGVCTLHIPGICIDRDHVAAHSNESHDGKGKGLKSHDSETACACPPCHSFIDDTRHPYRWDFMRHACAKTRYLLFERGFLVVMLKPNLTLIQALQDSESELSACRHAIPDTPYFNFLAGKTLPECVEAMADHIANEGLS